MLNRRDTLRPDNVPPLGSLTAAVSENGGDKLRTQWVDVARGLGITLVVWGHVLRGNVNLKTARWAAVQDHLIYSFHMPLFFLLAGLFLWTSLGQGRAAFLRRRWSALIWPYLLWSLVCGFIELGFSKFVNSPISAWDVIAIPIVPIEQFWFLYALLICQFVCLAGYPSIVRVWMLCTAGLLAWKLLGGGWIGFRAFLYLPFALFGVTSARWFASFSREGIAKHLTLMVGAAVALVVSLDLSQVIPDPYLGFVLSGLAGSLASIGLAMLLTKLPAPPASLFASLGRASLAIFVLHTLFSAGSRIMLKKIGVATDDLLSLAFCLVVGLLLPWLIFQAAQKKGWARLLGLSGS